VVTVPEERLKLAVFIDFDNIQIGVKDTLGKEFDVALVLEALKERGEVVAKVAYGDWSRAGDQSRQMTQHAIQMVQRSVTPRGDKNGADINLALDALEMAFTRHHITGFAIVGGDSDFMALVEKLKQFDKQVFVVGGRAFTSSVLQRNCTEFVAYENLLRGGSGAESGRVVRFARKAGGATRSTTEARALSEAVPNIERAMKILADRGVLPQLGLLKSTLLQLDSTFSERDYGTGSFLEFMQKVEQAGLAHLRKADGGYIVEPSEMALEAKPAGPAPEATTEPEIRAAEPESAVAEPVAEEPATTSPRNPADALTLLKTVIQDARVKTGGRPIYLRQVRGRLRALEPGFDERQYGYRGTLDLLHRAEREGWLKLQRDHQGVFRILPLAAPVAPPSQTETEPVPEQPQAEPGAESVPPMAELSQTALWEEAAPPTEIAPEGMAEEAPPAESPLPARKPRKPRTSKSPARPTRKRTAKKSPPAEE
jgi:uncharacterized LabA/DUF88 family protein